MLRLYGEALLPHVRSPIDLSVMTPVSAVCLGAFLRSTPDAAFLVEAFASSFHIPHLPVTVRLTSCNHQSAHAHAAFLDEYNGEELAARCISGPFLSPPHPLFISLPLGVTPKKEPGAFRVIHDLSYPLGRSVNSLIPQDLVMVSYKDFDHVSNLIVQAGPSAFIAKVDIQSAI